MLHEFIAMHREEIISRCRAKVATRSIPPPTELELDHGVPVFLDQLGDALRLGGQLSSPEICTSALRHGHELWLQGFTVSQVVHDFGNICQAITELAVEVDAPISTDDFRMLNRCLDDAIAGAVTEYSLVQDATRDGESHEMRDLIRTATVAFEVIRTGNVGVGGSTGAVLLRNLRSIDALANRQSAPPVTEGKLANSRASSDRPVRLE